MDTLKKYFLATALAGALYLGTAQISFGQNVVTNGDFTDFTTAPTAGSAGEGLTDAAEDYTGATLADWTNEGYSFVYLYPNVGTETIVGSGGNFSLNTPFTVPVLTGYTGNVVISDPVYESGAISETVNVTDGQEYAVSFYYAADRQSGHEYRDAPSANWAVSLVGTTTTTLTTATVSGGATDTFSGWFEATLDFTATTTGAETLSFLAGGGPTGDPPFALLADVTMTPVPEPATTASWTILFGMLIMFGNRAWRRYQKRPSLNT